MSDERVQQDLPEGESVAGMTDAELARFLGFGEAEMDRALTAVAALSPSKRAGFERMHKLVVELQLYEQGLGPRPAGVLVDWDRRRRR